MNESIKNFIYAAYPVKKNRREEIDKIIDCVVWLTQQPVPPEQIKIAREVPERTDEKITITASPFVDPEDHLRHMLCGGNYNEQ